MTPTTFGVILAIAAIVTMIAGTFLLINARAVIRLFRPMREAGSKEPMSWKTNRRQIIAALWAFCMGLAATLAIYVVAIDKTAT